ncbi:NAD(P)-dependent oxidoreductase [Nesterenkonia sp. HG001]|uniref:NAD(P)-dependent oxidoreductase n=1 Tax=Nesterenkonia sp. HG001 TaxID=2983207 RepID=UPI002AC58502|nr:NAD(P)H-binding protein [Nesterenkonia sp. HG001]MDZ5079159.1 NAD(P)H-binding protein [Nesterenkonia sp. HG001]
MTRIAVIGGTGHAGSHIAAEARLRGHHVTTVSRHPAQGLADHAVGSLQDETLLNRVASTHDILVVAIPGAGDPPLVDVMPQVMRAAAAHDARVGVVGGAASLRVSPDGPRLLDTPDFPPEYRAEATVHASVLETMQQDTSGARWFYLSPAAMFGAPLSIASTGAYRTSGDVLLSDEQGVSEISGADYARAFLDEIERPSHENTRFHVAR